MELYGSISGKVSTCLYIDRDILETPHKVGLNVSQVSENGLIAAIRRLSGLKQETGLESPSVSAVEGRGRDLDPGARLHRPIGYQATSPRPHFVGTDHF
jgi:post-segregation antitoxin (ccd killing protein)